MDCLMIVLGGHVTVKHRNDVLCQYKPEQIVALGSLGKQCLTMLTDLDLPPQDLNVYYGPTVKLTSSEKPY